MITWRISNQPKQPIFRFESILIYSVKKSVSCVDNDSCIMRSQILWLFLIHYEILVNPKIFWVFFHSVFGWYRKCWLIQQHPKFFTGRNFRSWFWKVLPVLYFYNFNRRRALFPTYNRFFTKPSFKVFEDTSLQLWYMLILH